MAMLNELKSSTTLLQSYLTWLINMSSGGVATYILVMFFILFLIVEAAYYKAEKRGFHPGNELRDWLEAKSEIIRSVYGERRVRNKLMRIWGALAGIMSTVLNGKNRKYPVYRKQMN
jgi:hypothetical protein